MKDNSEIKHWQSTWQQADRVWGHQTPAGQRKIISRARLLISSAGLNRRSQAEKLRVLELGCGTGAYTRQFIATGCRLTATDLVPELVRTTKRNLRSLNRHYPVRILVADAFHLPFAKNSFHAVIGNSLLHHLIPVSPGLTEIFRVLKPGGIMAFTEPNMLNPHIFLQKNIPLLKKLAGDSPGETAFIRWILHRQIESAGFEKISVRPFDFSYPYLPDWFIRLLSPFFIYLEKIPVVREFAGSLIITARKKPV